MHKADDKRIMRSLGVERKLMPIDYTVIDDSLLMMSRTIDKVSGPIDITDIMIKYNRVPRKAAVSRFFDCHVLSNFIRLGLQLIEEIDDGLQLIDQRNDLLFNLFNSRYFWTDNGAFLWSIEYADKWTYRIWGRIKVIA